MLLARAYFHLAQLGRAEAVLVELVEKAPTDAYADLLLGRTLQRAGRHEEAKSPLALAEILADYERPKAQGDVLSLSAVPVVYGSVSAQMGTLIGWD
ncbi:MAG: hypothetical protein L0H79_06280 [Intrasporangium sp.]|uniref:hypothetical protein n=1 Tax=Intrasporangium sp. TaxID=1925024 RepID=UPI0026484D7F|nr:hypothetical protein [Intrasporangium sp.]MDN5795344.1 hypothetical protein [Intrasporangium sp.]